MLMLCNEFYILLQYLDIDGPYQGDEYAVEADDNGNSDISEAALEEANNMINR